MNQHNKNVFPQSKIEDLTPTKLFNSNSDAPRSTHHSTGVSLNP